MYQPETPCPPAYSIRTQLARFDAFRTELNQQRPHEAIEDETPASRYVPRLESSHVELATIEYPPGFNVRTVAASSRIRWKSALVTIGHALEASQSESRRWTGCTPAWRRASSRAHTAAALERCLGIVVMTCAVTTISRSLISS